MRVIDLEQLTTVQKHIENRDFKKALDIIETFRFTHLNYKDLKGEILLKRSICLNRLGKGEEALKFAEEAYRKSEEIQDPFLSLDSKIEIGESLIYLGRIDECYSLVKDCVESIKALSPSKNSEIRKRRGAVEALIGRICILRGKRKSCLKHYSIALSIRSEIKNDPDLAETLTDMGFLKGSLGELEEALELFERSLKLEKYGYTHNIVRNLKGKGYVFLMRGEIDEAQVIFEKGLSIAKELNDTKAIARFNTNLAICYQKRGELDLALNCLETSLEKYHTLGATNFTGGTLDQLFHLSLERGDLSSARLYLQKLKELNSLFNNRDISSAYILNKTLLNFRSRPLSLKKLIEVKEKIRSESVNKYSMYELKIRSLFYLCEILFLAYQKEGKPSILEDINNLISSLVKLAKKNNSDLIRGEIFLLRAKLAINQTQNSIAREFLEEAFAIAVHFNLKDLKVRVQEFRHYL